MFERLGSLTYRFRFVIVVAWILGAAWAVLFAPSLASQGMTDQTSFLPSYTASMKAHDALEKAFPGSTSASSATLTFFRAGRLTDADRSYVADTAAWITSGQAPEGLRNAVTGVDTATSRPELASMLQSADGTLELATVNLNVVMAGGSSDLIVSSLRDHLRATAPAGLETHVTGAAGIGSDYLAAIVKGTDSTTLVTVLLVILTLLLIYRAPLAAMVPLVTIGAAFVVARGVLGVLALLGWKVSSLLDTFIVVLIFGVGTDYAIFLISRFREEVARGDWHEASRATVKRIGAVISASAATVIVGLAAMAFGDFGMIQTTGPALAVGIFVTLVAGLTLAPALLGIFGHYLFWPLHARTEPEAEPSGFFARLASAVSKRPAVVAAALLAALLVPAAAVPQMKTNFDVLAELPPSSDARQGFQQVADHLGRGKVFQSAGIVAAGVNTDLLAPASLARLRDLMQRIAATPGIAEATSLVTPNGDGVVPDGLRPSKQLATMATGFEGDTGASPGGNAGSAADSKALLDPKVSDGLATATEYVDALGAAFPAVGSAAELRTVSADLATAQDQVRRVRDSAVVSTQLRTLADAMTSPAAAASGSGSPGESIAIVGAYLDELAAAYPETATLAGFRDAKAAVASLERKLSVTAALDLGNALEALATHFDARPDATLFPESLAGTAEAKKARAAIEATFRALPADLATLAAVFAARSDDVFVPTGLGGDAGKKVDEAVAAFVSTDHSASRFWISTTDDPYSESAFATVRTVQGILTDAAPGFGVTASAQVGGTTAQFADVQTVLGHDFERVGIITVLGILVVLVLLLRAVVAPLYLVATVLLSCATALGLSSWLFQSVLGQPGVSFYLPIMVFVLLVALGSDYNIFLMSRVREESEGRPIRDGIRIASGRTGAVITSAGLILAGTFGSMASAPLIVLFQVGVAVGVGVLIDTFLVRSILVPAITELAGARAWWPSGTATAGRRWPVVIAVPEPSSPAAATSVGAGRSGRRLAVALAMIVLVPAIVAGLLAWSASNPDAHLRGVTAAVVNADAGTTVTGSDGTQKRLQLGVDLAAKLTSSTDATSFTWVSAAPDVARDGLADGRYGAVLTIPADFSSTIAAITSGAKGSTPATGMGKAMLGLQTNDATSYAVGSIAQSISAAIAASTAQTVTADYVDDVLVAVDDARAGLSDAAVAVDGVASSSSDLVTGAQGAAATAGELVTGLAALADGMTSAGGGADQLAAGVRSLAAGTDKLASGVATLGHGASSAAAGAGSLAGGAATLAEGLGALAASTKGLPAQAAALASGASGISEGAAGAAAGARALADSLATMRAGTAGLGAQAAALNDGAAGVDAGAASVAAGAAQSATATGELATGARALSASVADYAGAVASLASGCAALGGSEPLCAQLTALAASNASLIGGSAGVAAGTAQLADGSAGLAAGATSLASGAAALHAGTRELAASAPELESGIAQAATGAGSLADGAAALASGAASLASGTATLSASMPALTGAISDSAAGARAVAAGADGVATGVTKLAGGVADLETGARSAADGAAKLAAGSTAAATGAAKLASGMSDAADGARLVAGQVDRIATDGTSAAADAAALAAGLQADASAMPTYSDAARRSIGGLVADPVALEATRLNAVATSGAGLAPSILAIALWVGALATFLVIPALLGRVDRRRWWSRALAGLGAGAAIGIAQAFLAVLVLRYGVGVEVARLPELLACAVLAAVVAVAVVQALVALLDYRGWIVALLLVALQVASAGVVIPIETAPGLLQALHAVLPLTAAVDAFRALIAGGGPSLVVPLGVLVAWLIVAVLATLAVAGRDAAPREAALAAE